MDYVFDGTFKGLLTAVFDCFERKDFQARLYAKATHQNTIFGIIHQVYTDEAAAARVWKGLLKKLPAQEVRKLYVAFLSELPEGYSKIFKVIIDVFKNGGDILKNYGDADVLFINQLAKKVDREKHRMKAFVRFQKSSDGLYFSMIEPDFNVLPLIAKFFKDRYADQQWLIYEKRRGCGFFYDKDIVNEIELSISEGASSAVEKYIALDADELKYNTLWQDYFKSTNIIARKNTKLHVRHVPKRYWKYLTEKQA